MIVSAEYIRAILDAFPSIDPHEFATAYVNHVSRTGEKPNLWDALDYFHSFGRVAA